MNNLNDPLAQLKDIHLPPPVGWWPPAPGWWLLATALLMALIWAGSWLWKRYRGGRARREALRRLDLLRDAEPHLLPTEVARLLRQLAIARYGRAEVAPLTGAAWLQFLDRTGKTDQFSMGPGLALGTMLYQPTVAVEREQLCRVAEAWIRRQRPC